MPNRAGEDGRAVNWLDPLDPEEADLRARRPSAVIPAAPAKKRRYHAAGMGLEDQQIAELEAIFNDAWARVPIRFRQAARVIWHYHLYPEDATRMLR